MWSFDRAKPGLRALLGLLALAGAVPLAGCIQPLYGANGAFDNSALASELQAIEVDEMNGRMRPLSAQRPHLRFQRHGSTVQPRYRLSVVLRERVQTPTPRYGDRPRDLGDGDRRRRISARHHP